MFLRARLKIRLSWQDISGMVFILILECVCVFFFLRAKIRRVEINMAEETFSDEQMIRVAEGFSDL